MDKLPGDHSQIVQYVGPLKYKEQGNSVLIIEVSFSIASRCTGGLSVLISKY